MQTDSITTNLLTDDELDAQLFDSINADDALDFSPRDNDTGATEAADIF